MLSQQNDDFKITKDMILNILRPINDPDLGVSIVDLGLIRDVKIDGKNVYVGMILTSPGCPYGPMLLDMVERKLKLFEDIEDSEVELLVDQYLKPEDLSDEMRLNLGLDF